jgi:bacteriocin-like protein
MTTDNALRELSADELEAVSGGSQWGPGGENPLGGLPILQK